MPLCVNEEGWNDVQRQYNRVKEIADENGIMYFNYMYMDVGIDISFDFYDYEHLNIEGGLKVTNHIADYLHATYELRDHRQDAKYSIWNSDYELYKKQKEMFLADFSKRYRK